MEFIDIETFLAIVESGSIGKAAEKLFIGQGTASSRIKRLEDELNIQLLFRQQGVRKLTLTPEGEYFLSIAKEWYSLYQQSMKIRDMKIYSELRIAATDSINRFLFEDVYPYFMIKNPNTMLFLQTEHSTEIHQLIEQQAIDIGFVTTLHKFPNILAKPVLRENLVLLCHQDNPFVTSENLKDLKPEDEIYSIYSHDYELWHKRNFQTDRHKVTIGTLSMLNKFILYPNTWAIVAHSAADHLEMQHHDLVVVPFKKDPPPIRTFYLIYYRHAKPWVNQMTAVFMKDLIDVISSFPNLEIVYTENQ